MTRFIPLIFCMLSTYQTALAQDVYRPFVAGRFDSYLNADYFSSSSNYDSNGSKQNLISGASLQNISTEMDIRYLFWDKLGIYTGLLFNNVQTSNGVRDRSNSNLSYYSFGADLEVYHNYYWTVYVDGNYRMSNEEINVAGDDALTSDGANEGNISGVGIFQADSWRFYGKAGYGYRAEGLSQLVRYGFGGDYAFGSFRVGLNFPGYSTVQDDEKTATAIDRDLLTTRVNGGSRRYYAVNPNSLEGQLYAIYNMGKDFSVKVYGGSTIIGSNSAEGIVAGLALNWGFGIAQKTFKSQDVPNNSSLPDDEAGFKVNTNDGVDQGIFQKSQSAPVPPKKK